MSGSLLPVGNVFANEQSTRESSISSTEAKQETQHTEKTSENSEDDKISITETAANEDESTKGIYKSGQRSYSQTVNTPEQLQSALTDTSISEIVLGNSITLNSDITLNHPIQIEGNGNTLNLGGSAWRASAGVGSVKFSNLSIISTRRDIWGAMYFDADGDVPRVSNVYFENVSYSGYEFLDLRCGTINFSGSNQFISTENNDEVMIAQNIILLPNSQVDITHSNNAGSGNRGEGSLGLAFGQSGVKSTGSLTVSSGAKLTINGSSPNWGIGVEYWHYDSNTTVNIQDNASIDIKNTGSGRGMVVQNINLDASGSLNISTNADYAIYNNEDASQSGIYKLSGKFDIASTKGRAFNLKAGSTINFGNIPLSAWSVGNVSSSPIYSWNSVAGTTILDGINTVSSTTNNPQFNQQFVNQNFGRLASEGKELIKTTINEVKDTDIIVSGKGEPNGKIELKVGDQVIASGTVGSDGNYSLTIPKQSAGTVIKAMVSMDGQTSEADTTVVRTALTQTTISDINTETTQVSGKGEPNAPIKIMNGDQIIAQGVVGSGGNYTLTIPKQAKDSVIKAIVEKDGLTSEAQTIVKQGSLAQTTISEINTETTQVSGKGEPNAPIKIMNGDQIIAQGVIGSDGNYTLTIPKQAKDSVIKAIVEKDGLTSEAQTTVTQGSLVQTTISDIDTNTTSISGKGEPNAKIELKVGDQVIASGRIGSDGYYSLTIPKQSVGTVVKAMVSANGLTSEAQTTVTRADLAPTTISKVDSQTTVITGTGEPGGKIELLNGNQLIAQGYVGEDGRYSLTVMKQTAGSTIVARVTMDGKESQASTVVEEKINLQAPVIDKFTEGDVYAKGTAGKDATKVAIFVNGVQRRVAAVSNGKYSIYAGDLGLKAGDTFEIAGIAADGTVGPKTSATVQKNPVLELTTTIDKFTEGDVYAKGTAGKDATKVAIFVNGVQRRVAAISNGKYSIYAGDLGLKAGDTFEIAGIAA
ncbi:Ig-like domain-containing protein, partial [Enterococcus mundtii]|uniref:Ig-like domain-containing protein n=1 Tax=Enterococcus mundtii TaxID=53346 RepID=UPI001C6136D8